MANNFQNGSDLLIYIGTGSTATPIAWSRNCSVSMSTNMADATTKSNDGWQESIPTTKSWSIDTDGLGVWNENIKDFMQIFDDRTPIQISFKPRNIVTDDMIYSGEAFIESLDIEAPMEDGVTFKVSLKGSGKLDFTVSE